MKQGTQPAELVISVDLVGQAGEAGRSAALLSSATWLLGQFARHDLAATWVVDPSTLVHIAPDLVASRPAMEVAMAGQAAWCGAAVSRARFSNALVASLNQIRDFAARPTTLSIAAGDCLTQLDLLVKHGINAVRLRSQSGEAATHSRAPRGILSWLWPAAPRDEDWRAKPLRFGVWQVPTSLILPSAGWRVTKATVDSAVRGAPLVQLAIDVESLTRGQLAAQKDVERLLTYVALRRGQDLVLPGTIAAAVQRLTTHSTAAPAHSILRPSAA